jgi:hypothetical protein
MPQRRFPPPWSVEERGAKRKPRGTTGAKKNTRVELFYAVGSPFVITRGCHPRYGREVANGHPVPPAGDAIELAGAVYIVPSPFGLGSVPLSGVRAKKLVSGRIDVLAGAIVIYLTVNKRKCSEGYVFALRSERRLCCEVRGNLAYRWFCSATCCNDVT